MLSRISDDSHCARHPIEHGAHQEASGALALYLRIDRDRSNAAYVGAFVEEVAANHPPLKFSHGLIKFRMAQKK